MAKKIQIELTTAALKKLDAQNIRYTVINDDLELQSLLYGYGDGYPNADELDGHEQNLIYDKAQEAMEQGVGYGIAIDIRSGRDNQDERCYWLDEVKVVERDKADITVEQMNAV